MLTCEICGEELMLEEDMKTHLLLSHLENDMHCPLCSLAGVSFNELSFHISTAHPEEHTNATCFSGSSKTKNVAISDRRMAQTSKSFASGNSCDSSGEAITSRVHADSGQTGKNNSPHAESFWLKARLKESCPKPSTSCCKETVTGNKSDHTKEEQFFCPMCSMVCSSPFILQEHVELHLQDQHSDQKNTDCDLKLAIQLQHEEEQKRRQEEAWQEKENFKKLQRRFGVGGGGGGYRQQMERSMEKAVASGRLTSAEFHSKKADMMESLASGMDDGSTRTQGITRALCDYYQTGGKDCAHVWLSADTDHYSSSVGDKGWGCGYRNFQMLLSSLQRIDTYASILQDRTVPCIPRIQGMIEEAWREGLDPQGASHFNQRLKGTRAWIGATEIYVLLTSLGVSGHIIDFHQSTGADGTHPKLFDWVKQYFCQSSQSGRLLPRLIQTNLPPLYLQHQGHSRSIVGLEQRKNGEVCLLLLDPGSSAEGIRKLLSRDFISTAVRLIRRFPRNLKHHQYQLVAAQGVLSAEEKQAQIFNSKILRAERIP
ncbi:zinc finger-containing ubiquitin peptidase 1 isoform X1 [Nothobranchius furzeri]|uniref:Zinc finger-containing ubiquitin peptidase 1 n=1 Tax=Nothobranchius furzeri TaxID=105023 RepID=A0A1A8BA29_NOTFU|nr:zinc finger with UFM1 specific peptidase domain [Nothobranchius furzeri]